MKNLIIVIHILLTFLLVGCVDKGVYVGEKKDGERHGHGTLTFSKRYYDFWKFPFIFKNDGYKYVGEFLDGEKNGQGTFTYPDGQKYVGRWKDDKRNGQGTFTYPDGIKWEGVWRRSEPWNITKYDKDGKIYGRKVNGVKR